MIKIKIPAALFSIAALSACGGSNSNSDVMENVPDPTPAPVLSVAADGSTVTARDALDGGLVLFASGTETSTVALDFNNDVTELTDSTLSISLNENGELVTTLNGREVVFSEADRDGDDGFERDLDPGFVGIFGQSNPLQEILGEGEDYSAAVSYILADGDGSFTYAIVGTQTAIDSIPNGEANYEGQFKVEFVPATDFESFSGDRSQIRGDTTINLNMNGELSGVIDDLSFRAPGEDDREPILGSITMTTASIDDGAFSGSLTADADLLALEGLGLTDDNLGTYAGRFYGPNGEEVAGTVAATVQTDEGVQNGVGFFLAD